MKARTRPANKESISRPSKRLDLDEGEKGDFEIRSAVRRTQGMIKIDPQAAKEIAESDEYSPLAE